MKQSWVVEPFEVDGGELAIEIPSEILNELNWDVGDELTWVDNKDGSWTLKRIVDNGEK
jgi:hypothetical protein